MEGNDCQVTLKHDYNGVNDSHLSPVEFVEVMVKNEEDSHMENMLRSTCPPIKFEPETSDDDDKQHVPFQNFQFVEVKNEVNVKNEIEVFGERSGTESEVFIPKPGDESSLMSSSDHIKINMRGSHMENIIQSACPPIKSEPDFSNDDDDKQHVQLQNFQFVEVDGEEILKSEIDIYEETFSTEMKVFKSERKDVPSPVCNSDQIKVQELLKSETDICEKMIGTKLRAFKSETKDDPYTMCSSDHIKIGTLKSEIDICEETFGTESEVFVSKTRDDPSLMCSSDQIKIVSIGSSNTGNFMLEIQDDITCRSTGKETQLEKELSAESVNMPTLKFENTCIRFLVCPNCESVFSSPEELASHQLNCNFVRRVPVITAKPHSECKSQFPCPFCNKILDSIVHFNCHLLTHTEEPVFKCRWCNITFQDNRTLVEHLKIHTFIHSFMCDICGKSFPRKHRLKRHKKIHTGECPFSCKLCGKTFMQRSYLDCHSLSHTGEDPYTCDHCGMSFYKKGGLIYHIRHNHIVSHTQGNTHS